MSYQKGQTNILIFVGIFFVFITFFTTQIQPDFPDFFVADTLDVTAYLGTVTGVTIGCVVITGGVCALALTIATLITTFGILTGGSIGFLLLTPITIAFIIALARLGRG